MANPTTNFGWVMPTSTDLVTDLPADFAVFGQGVDTTVKALNPETTLGDISYRSSTANTKTRLGIGSAGQVLGISGGVPAWVTPAAGALTLITSATAAGTSASLSVNDCFSSTYTNYLILSDMKCSVEQNFYFRLRASGTDATSDYYYGGFWTASNGSSLNPVNGAAQSVMSLRDIGTERGLTELQISNPFNAIDTTILASGIQSWAGSNTEAHVINGAHHMSSSYDGFTLLSGAGTLTGTVRIYGYANS